jgi:signal transduction histidine kinase/ActR/RegA family two-component response regulator
MGGISLAAAATRLPLEASFLAQAVLFVCLATAADLKRLKLRSANYSVATATNFACALLLGPDAAALVSAAGAASGDLVTRKPRHKVLFNAAAVSLSVAAGGHATSALRAHPAAPSPEDLPAYLAYALVHVVVNQALVCLVIALATRTPLRQVVAANYRGVAVPIVALYPLGLLMAVVYAAFGGWVGLLLLVLPAVAAYAAIDKARQLQAAYLELQQSAEQKAALLARLEETHGQLRTAHAELEETHGHLRATHEELQATQAKVVAQERLRALGQMASGIAHDFNNALAPVVGFSELLLTQPEQWSDPRFMRQYLELIHTSAQDATNVVRKLREFYRKRDEQEVLAPLDLNPLVQQAVDITQPRWRDQAQATGRTIAVATELGALPPVAGEESALRELLTNLIFNAVDAMPNGGAIRVRTSNREAGWVALEVTDTGTGMTEEVRRRCLDPFFTTKGNQGTGLGLAMVHGIVERHGGRLEIDSAWGKGTTFRILLPGCASQQPQDAGAADLPGAGTAGANAAEGAARRLSVLVVDDEPTVRQVMTSYLAALGHVPVTATGGHDGLRQFRGGAFDLVITDRAMPDMHGDALAAAIKGERADVPIIMLTGFGDMIHALDERPGSIDLVLGKPVLLTDLVRAIEQVTGPTESTTPAAPTTADRVLVATA